MIGIVVEGGASRTYYAVGVMDSLMRAGISFDYIGGASAGISNAVNYASGQMGRALEIGVKFASKEEYYSLKNFLNRENRSFFGVDYIFKEIPQKLLPYDFDALRKYEGIIEATVTNVETGKSEYLPVSADDKGFDALIASCSLPGMFPIKEIDGKKYLDGGISDAVPYKRAFEKGCDKVVVVLSREREYIKKSGGETDFARLLYRKYPNFCQTLKNRHIMYNRQREELFRLEEEGKVYILSPGNTNGWKRTENRPEILKSMYEEGTHFTNRKLGEIRNFLK